MTTIIAVANMKGGVGKTTTAVNLGAWFARAGRKTLIVDTDSQGHVAMALGKPKGDGLFQALVAGRSLHQATVEARPGLDILANDHTSELVKEHFTRVSFREFLIATMLEQAREYQVVILDTPPSTDVLHVATLVASEYLIIPAKMDYLAMDGVMAILATVTQLGRYPNVEPPTVIGVLPTLYDRNTKETQENVARLAQAIGADLILPPVPSDTKLREATSYGDTIWEYAPDCQGAVGWKAGTRAANSLGKTGGYLHLAEIVEGLVWR